MTRLGIEPTSSAAQALDSKSFPQRPEHWKNELVKKTTRLGFEPTSSAERALDPPVGQTELRTIQAECGLCILLDLDVWRSMPSHFYRELPRNTRYQYFLSYVT